ncbi:hypothetical protein BBD41_26785 [Paenibacillus ihbetae]|uniref:Methylamine utilisation protein MauE domain-containing protein n=1 Tax=Paenibacillus ihbetae TaxID=1870820 RepID=A0A1B2E7F3_9BACL|nr:MauE/DoxX family redox-associated membrane protein [Paenibacillus ihbetae]ANY75891.1 hypothetical protein BBD41_26785 [Paenibacillus ihbetae]
MYEFAAISSTFPMLLSVTGYIWSAFFGDPDRFPGSPRLHALLVLLQFLTVTMVYGYPSSMSFVLLSVLYFTQGIGVVYYIRKKGRVDCGCLGPQFHSRLGWPLIAVNGLMGMLSWGWSHPSWFIYPEAVALNGFLLEGMLLLVSLLVIVGIPDAVHAIRIYRELAAPHAPYIKPR